MEEDEETITATIWKRARPRGKWAILGKMIQRPWAQRSIQVQKRERRLSYRKEDDVKGEIDLSGLVANAVPPSMASGHDHSFVMVDSKGREIMTFSCENDEERDNLVQKINQIASFSHSQSAAIMMPWRLSYQSSFRSSSIGFGNPSLRTMKTAQQLLAGGNLQQARSVAAEYLDERYSSVDNTEFVTWYASLLLADGSTGEASQVLSRVVAAHGKSSAPNDTKLLSAISNIALISHDGSKLSEAESMARRVLGEQESQCGPDSVEAAIALSELGFVLYSECKLDESESVLQRAREIFEARILVDSGPDESAEDVAKRALVLSHRRDCLSNLAMVLTDLKKYADAAQIYEIIVPLKMSLHGPDHYDTLASLWNYSKALLALEDFDQAKALCNQALSGFSTVFGRSHKHTVACAQTMIDILSTDGQREGHSLTELEKFLDSISGDALGLIAEECTNPHVVARVLKRVYAEKLASVGGDSADALQAQFELATAYYLLEEYEHACENYSVVFYQRMNMLEEFHPNTVVTAKILGPLAIRCNRLQVALAAFEYLLRQNSQESGDTGEQACETQQVIDYIRLVLMTSTEPSKLSGNV